MYYLTNNELKHHGILGQKWGQRRFQNEDGSLTPAGRQRYGYLEEAANKAKKFANYAKQEQKKYSKGLTDKQRKNGVTKTDVKRWEQAAKVQREKYEHLAKKYSSLDVSKLDKQTIQDAKRFVKHEIYADVNYNDYFASNRWHNSILDEHQSKSFVSPTDKTDYKSTGMIDGTSVVEKQRIKPKNVRY